MAADFGKMTNGEWNRKRPDQWRERDGKLISCPNVTFAGSSLGKITKRKMKAGQKLTIVPKDNKAFLETDKVTPYVHCRCT
jgi:hypothetical protein